jgi:SRSO17 transposase
MFDELMARIAGRTGNAQVAVYLIYAAAAGHAAIDRELYLPGFRWSDWRRRHQHRARTCHYQRQAREP